MFQSYKYRIYPNKAQEEQIIKTFGCVRWVYNHFLDSRAKQYKSCGKTLNSYADSKELTLLKKDPKTLWLAEADKFALRNALFSLDEAFKNFFSTCHTTRHYGFPKFKSRKRSRNSYTTNFTNGNIAVGDGWVKLPKLGRVRAVIHRHLSGRIVSAAVSKLPSGEYYVSVCCDDVEFEQYAKTNKSVGIDLGISRLAALSNGGVIENPKKLKKKLKKLARAQRVLARKQRGSKNREKARLRTARIHRDITFARRDIIHKATAKLVREYDVIAAETLSVKKMQKNKSLAREISDAGWGEFLRQLAYKCERHGRSFIQIPRYFASSQTCCGCGAKNPAVRDLGVREWTCSVCGAYHDRDFNAAVNILNEALRLGGLKAG